MNTRDALHDKEEALYGILSKMDRVYVAFSGGVDSAYLLAACLDVLGPDSVLALTIDSPLVPDAELETAQEIASLLGARQRVVPFDELEVDGVISNPPRRCYHCKRARFEMLLTLAQELDDGQLLHGENADDQKEYRPGAAAARELGVRAPLAEAGLTKDNIRRLSRERGLPGWDRPATACLATRFPYGTSLTREGLERVEEAEGLLHDLLPISQLRVRDHYPVARIEVPPDRVRDVIRQDLRTALVKGLHEIGYRYVTLDLEGYRMGSMDESIE
ncbi:MAG: ATP-dependent sacrificial sulfur transferase LarE [Chloroflexota bacterium]|nr:ATP-dependent sacrificial sulfur transferase LarE [Chloroflexota bacterium]